MKPTHNIVVAQNYTKDGEEKTRWHNIGVLFTGEINEKRRTVIKITNIPTGSWDGFANVFPITKKKTAIEEAKEADETQSNEHSDNFDEPVDLSDIPF